MTMDTGGWGSREHRGTVERCELEDDQGPVGDFHFLLLWVAVDSQPPLWSLQTLTIFTSMLEHI